MSDAPQGWRRLRSGLAKLYRRDRPGSPENDLRRLLDTLQESELRYRLLAENATDMIVRLSLDGVRTYVSPASTNVVGYAPEQLVGISTFRFVHPDDDALVRERMRKVREGEGDQRGPNRVIRADGSITWVEANLRLVRDPATGKPVEIVGVTRDITERQRSEARIQSLAHTDQLTALPNRRTFLQALQQHLESGRSCGLLFIDLDHFKPVNDLHGHSVGDEVLAEAASRLRRHAPDGAMLARLGGDEFGALLDGGENAETVAATLLRALDLPIVVGDVVAEIGASIGVAISSRDGCNAEALLRAADMAMYDAKRTGKGQVRSFRPALEDEQKERALLTARLRDAVAREEIVPFYQPLRELRGGRLVGLEVLARWQHPQRGTLPPSEFITQAEESGVVTPMFRSLLCQVCRDAVHWPTDLRFAFNLSPQQLQDPTMAQEILLLAQEGGMDPRRLEIEVTETGIVRDVGTARRNLAELKAAGVTLALDDFGTGYASIAMLKALRVDRLKIDRSFIASMRSTPEDTRYVAAIIALATTLGLGTTAEGLEDEAAIHAVGQMGADLGQGYAYGRPSPAVTVVDWLSPHLLLAS
ncbi:putative bifunctional diguanylate cyclase/phosphodiesterase [Pseudoroseomonas globiformis]|uniref:Bifunctional diguanylate cyclase/phosphodiesterase n=1 Tax=Teichococcus globiformis TaxID=2307229 RepID=A0ABV7G4E1_9PROT